MNEQQKKDSGRRKKNDLNLGTMVYGKVPPQAVEIEQAILGALMIDKSVYDMVSDILKPEMFYKESHIRICRAIHSLGKKSQPIDLLTVAEELRTTEELELIGGGYYLTTLTNSVVSGAHTIHHCRIIQQKYIQREIIKISGELISEAYEDSCDVFELTELAGKKMDEVNSIFTQRGTQQLLPGLVRSMQRIEMLRHQDNEITGVPSDFHKLDQITYGWQNTDLIILAARPSVGKTAFALNLARNAVMNKQKPTPTLFFSMEMSYDQLVNRIISSESEIWLEKIARGKMEDHEMKMLYTRGIQPLSNAKLYIDDTAALTVFELKSIARRMKRECGIGLIIVDYLQLMSGDTNDSKNREREISQISRNLKQMAKELNVPVIALSQLSREVEKRKGDQQMPKLSDLRESGAIEQDADMVMFLYRPEYHDVLANEMGESTQGLTYLSIAKHRNGKLANGNEAIQFRALLHIQKFVPWEQEVVHVNVGSKMGLGAGNWKPVSDIDSGESISF